MNEEISILLPDLVNLKNTSMKVILINYLIKLRNLNGK